MIARGPVLGFSPLAGRSARACIRPAVWRGPHHCQSSFWIRLVLHAGRSEHGLGLAGYRFDRGVYKELAEEAQLRRTDVPWLAVAIGMGGVVGPVLLMLGLSHATASSSALLLNTEGLATMAIAWIVFRENVDQRLIFGAFAILAGAVLLSWNGEGVSFGLGSLLVIAVCIAWGRTIWSTRSLR